jgi:hypothetical protein
MTKIDPNKLAIIAAILALAILSVFSGYRLEIGPKGLKFENGQTESIPMKRP